MNDILYYYRCTIKNTIIRVLKKPVNLIGYLFFIGIFVLNIFNTSQMDVGEGTFVGEIIYAVIGLVLLTFSVLLPIYNGTKTFTLKFLPADGIYMMSGPVKPRKILWYGQLKQSLMGVMVGFIMLIQIPTLKSMVGMNDTGIALFVMAFITLTLLPNFVCLMAFVLGLKYERIRLFIRMIVMFIILASIMIITSYLMKGGDLLENLHQGLTSDYWILVPLVGWIQILIAYSIIGKIGSMVYVAVALLVSMILLSILVINRFADVEFFEEALNTALNFDKMRKQMKSGKSKLQVFNEKRKVRLKVVEEVRFRSGVMALLDKQLLMMRKKKLSFVDLQTLLIVSVICGLMIFTTRMNDVKDANIFITLGVLAYGLFFVQLLGGFDDDTDRHYIYMFPYPALHKLFALHVISMVKIMIECSLSFLIAGLVTGTSIGMVILAGLLAGLIGINFSLISLLANVVFGSVGTLPLKVFMRIVFDFIALAIAGTALGLGYGLFHETVGLIFGIITLVMIAVLIMIPVSLKLTKPEFNE